MGRAVATAHPLATDAAVGVLRAGGNAVDAAVAAAWALAVCEPSGSGLGGQTTAVVRFRDGRTLAFAGNSRAPAAAGPRSIRAPQQRAGARAQTTPTTPAVLEALHRAGGRLDFEETLAPAIRLASEGFDVSPLLARQVRWCLHALARSPLARELFLPGGRPLTAGARLRQPRLARTLRRIAAYGCSDFYTGGLARRWIRDLEAQGALLDAEDLRRAAKAEGRPTIAGAFRTYPVVSAPPPAGGFLLLLGLALLERLAPQHAAWDHPDRLRAVALASREVFLERDRMKEALHELGGLELMRRLDRDRVARLARRIRSRPRPPIAQTEEPTDTSHLCVADLDGNVVSLTQSIQSLFGAKEGSPSLGFLYNNYLLTCPRSSGPHRLAPRCRPRSNVAPLLVFEGADPAPPRLAAGAAGSRRIVSSLLQVLGLVLDGAENLPDAVARPRLHLSTRDRLWFEKPLRRHPAVVELAEVFRPVPKSTLSYAMGAVQAIERRDTGWTASADPRREGAGFAF